MLNEVSFFALMNVKMLTGDGIVFLLKQVLKYGPKRELESIKDEIKKVKIKNPVA